MFEVLQKLLVFLQLNFEGSKYYWTSLRRLRHQTIFFLSLFLFPLHSILFMMFSIFLTFFLIFSKAVRTSLFLLRIDLVNVIQEIDLELLGIIIFFTHFHLFFQITLTFSHFLFVFIVLFIIFLQINFQDFIFSHHFTFY